MHIHKLKKAAKKATSIFVSLTTAIWLSGFGILMPIAAHGQSVTDLQAQIKSLNDMIAALQAQISGMSATPSSTSAGMCTFTKDLTVGSSGMDVKCLQQYLNSAGHVVAPSGAGSPGMESEYFGSRTQSAVGKWQTANGVSPAAGYFGAKSRAKYSMLMASVPPTTTPPTTTPGPVTGPMGTGLMVGTATQPAATLAVQNGVHIPFTAFTLKASSDGAVTVDSLMVERTGLANDAAFSGLVVLDENMMSLTATPKTLNSNHQALLPDDIIIPAGQTKTFYIAGNMASSLSAYAGQVASLTLVAVNSSAQVTGSLPITGVGHTLNASLSIGSITLQKGSLDPSTGATKEVGTTGYTFAGIKATAGSNEDMLFKSIRWNQSGSAAKGDLANLKTVVDGTEYETVASADGKYYTSSFGSGITLTKGQIKEISIKGDIASGSNRGIDFDVFRYDDLVFEGKTFHYKVMPSATNSGDSSTDDDGTFQSTNPVWDAYEVTVSTGSLLVDKSNNVAAGNLANGGKAVGLGAFSFEAKGEPISFTSWVMTVATTVGTAGDYGALTNVAIYDENGNSVAGPKDFANKTTTITFTDTVTIPIGAHVYTVRGDLDSNWGANDTIVLSFNPSSALSGVTGEETGNTVTPNPNATVTANTQTVKAGGLTVSPASSLTSQSVIVGASNMELGRFTVDGSGSAEDLRITTIQVRSDVTSMDVDNITNIRLYDGATQLNTGSNVLNPSGNTAGTDSNLTITMDTPGWIIPKGTSKTLTLKGNVGTNITAGHAIKFDFSAGSPDWTVTGVNSTATISETLNTGAGATMTFRSGGGYSVAAAPSQPQEKWVTAGATGVTLNVLRFTSTAEEFALTDLRLQIDTSGSSTAADFAKIYLYNGSTLVQSKVPAFTNGVEDFTFPSSGTGSFMIPKDSFKELTIKADIAMIGASEAGVAGQLLGVDYDGATSSKNKAIGKSSGTSVHSSTASDVGGNGVVYFRSVPTLERVALPVTTLTSGNQVLYKFKVTADPAYDVAMHKFMFTIATTGPANMQFSVNPANLTLWNTTDNKRVAAATGAVAAFYNFLDNYNSSSQLVVRVYADTTDYTNAWVTVPAGQTHTFELRGDVVTDGSGDSVSTKLLGDDARSPRLVLTGASAFKMMKVRQIDVDTRAASNGTGWNQGGTTSVASSSSFIWSDFSSDATTTHSVNTADWMNGFKLPGLLSTGLDASTLSN